MKNYILLMLCSITLQAHAVSYDQHMIERANILEISLQEEYEYDTAMTRYPSFINNLYDAVKAHIKDLHKGLWNLSKAFNDYLLPKHTHKETPAFVRYAPNDELCYEERSFIHNRERHVKEALEQFLDMPLDKEVVPHIGFCFSGGGFRAMILTLGFLKAAQDIGLFDATMFMTGSSGSSWAIAPWIASNEPMDVYMNRLSKKIEKGLDHINDPKEIKLFMQQLMVKIMHKQPICAMDLYGAVLANTLLCNAGDSRIQCTLTQSHQDVLMGFLPMPIYSAIETNKQPYQWMECTPFEIGSEDLQAYVPTWAYGRKFRHGASLDYAPEQSLGYFLGIFGSAFEVNFNDIVYHTKDQLAAIKAKLPKPLQRAATNLVNIIANSPLNELRLFPSMLRNFTHNIQWSPLAHDKQICLVDAGIDFNIPFPPLLRPGRKLDLIIVYDASSTIAGCPELKRAELYAWQHRLKFPKIDYAGVDSRVVSVFKDEDPETPVVIYFPRITNPAYSAFDPEYCTQESYCQTLNFTYSHEQFKELAGLAEFTLTQHSQLIKTILKEIVVDKWNAHYYTGH